MARARTIIRREAWRPIAEFQDYAISSLGRVKRTAPDSYGRNIVGLLKPFVGNHGYCVVTLHNRGRQVTRLVHRLVCITFRGAAPNKKAHAAHKDGNRINNRAGNVRWRTPSENNFEKHKHGTMRVGDNHHARYMPECMPRGSSHGNAKLSEKSVSKILRDKRVHSIIAADYGVTHSLISMIKRREIWAHVAG